MKNDLNAILQLSIAKESGPRCGLIEGEPGSRVNIDREVRHVSILWIFHKAEPRVKHRKIHSFIHKINNKKKSNLEERVPEKIEREIATGEKKEGDLGDAVELNAKSVTRRRRDIGRWMSRVEGEESEEGESHGEEKQQLQLPLTVKAPPPYHYVSRRRYCRCALLRRHSCFSSTSTS